MRIDDRTGRQSQGSRQQLHWEYLSRTMDVEADLTQYGIDGWELVSVFPIPHNPMSAVFHFKRRR